jgi:hypothetical protein
MDLKKKPSQAHQNRDHNQSDVNCGCVEKYTRFGYV